MFEQFKNQIFKKEFPKFLFEGLLIVFIVGGALGFLDIALMTTDFLYILRFFTFYMFYIVLIRRLRGSFSAYFKIYSVLAVVFLYVGLYVMGVSSLFAYTIIPGGPSFSPVIFNPLIAFRLYAWTNAIDIIFNLINVAFYILIGVFTYRNMKR